MTVARDGIVKGSIYRFVYVATNSLGDSAYSNELIAGVGNPPAATDAPMKNILLTNATSMYIYWIAVTTSDLPVKGYYLYMDDGLGGDYSIVYDGSLNP